MVFPNYPKANQDVSTNNDLSDNAATHQLLEMNPENTKHERGKRPREHLEKYIIESSLNV